MTINEEIARFSVGANAGSPSRLGLRYSKSEFLPEAGNTVVCHLDHNDSAHKAVLEARTKMQSLPAGENFLSTPPQSLHMTIFEGVIESRRTPDAWPTGLDRAMTIDSVTEAMLERLSSFQAPTRFDVCVETIRPTGLVLKGATSADVASMNAWREALVRSFGYRHDNHDGYRFHMTFGYPIGWIPDKFVQEWSTGCERILKELQQNAAKIPLKAPAFCQFADMTCFEELLVLE